MGGYLDSVRNSKNYNNYKLTADKVVQILSDVRDERTKSRRRWIWELMQNAKDVRNKYGAVTIEIELKENEFVFKHNGDPFGVENITGLIQQVSSGKPSDSTNKRITGKFGTGFISTHLLSDIVTVEGIVELESYLPKKFKLELNRKATKSEDLIEFIALELDKIEQIENEEIFPTYKDYNLLRSEEFFDSIFTYPIENNESKSAALIGVEDLSNTLPQTLIFVTELKKVIIKNSIKNQNISYEIIKSYTENGFQFSIVRELINGVSKELNYIICKTEQFDLALQVDNFIDKTAIYNEESPRLYRDFPLVGTETFHYPFILNGLNFFPTDKRDSILLTDTNNISVQTNRTIINNSIEKAKEFITWLIDNNTKNLSVLAQSRIPTLIHESEVLEWYKNSIQINYRKFLLDKPIVESSGPNLVLRTAIIPKTTYSIDQNEMFWDITASLFGENKLCKKNQLISWHKYIGPENEIKTWEHKMFFTIENLLEEIQNKEKLDNLTILNPALRSIDWLNMVYQFLIDNKLTEYFKEYKILPTINGKFKSLKDNLFTENKGQIPTEFILILKSLKEDWNDILLDRNVIKIDLTQASKTVKDISDEINMVLNFEEKNDLGLIQKTFLDQNDCSEILLNIIRIHNSAVTGTFQDKLFTLAKTFLKSNSEKIIINDIQDFNFNPAKRQLIKLLNTKIELCVHLDKIDIPFTIKWLAEYLYLLQDSSEFKNLMEYGNIIPNRYSVLSPLKELYNYGTIETPLNDDLIEILHELNKSEDWKKVLVHDDLKKLNLPSKKFEELSNKIQEELEKLRMENSYSSYSSTILKLINWCSNHQLEAQKYFLSFMTQKDKIFVNISLEDKEVGGNIVKLLRNKEKLNDLAAIAESGVNLSILSAIAEIAKTIDISEIRELAQQLKDEKDDFEFKKKIGETIELAFIETFISLNLPYKITYQGIGSQDVIISNMNNNKSFFIELKSFSQYSSDKCLKLSLSQAERAVELKTESNYAVSVLIRPTNWEFVSVSYVKENLQNLLKVGSYVQEAIEHNKIFETIISSTNEVKLSFEDPRRKVKLTENVWKSNCVGFEILILNIKEYLL